MKYLSAYLIYCSRRLTGHSQHPSCRHYWSLDYTDLLDILLAGWSAAFPSSFPDPTYSLHLATEHASGWHIPITCTQIQND